MKVLSLHHFISSSSSPSLTPSSPTVTTPIHPSLDPSPPPLDHSPPHLLLSLPPLLPHTRPPLTPPPPPPPPPSLPLPLRYLYWTDLGQTGAIPTVERIHMNGTYEGPLSTSNPPIVPTNIAVDVETGDVYWVNNHTKSENIVHYDILMGVDQELPDFGLQSVLGLAVLGNHVYWTDRGRVHQSLARAVLQRDRTGDMIREVLLLHNEGLLGLVGVDTTYNIGEV